MFAITSKEMKELEKRTITDFDISEEILMERAGISVVQAIWNEYGELPSKSFVIVCGSGNNGGDGYVAARDLLNYTEAVRVISVGYPTTEVARKNYERYLKHGGIVYNYSELGLEEASKIISEADIVIDALFGTGLNREISDEELTKLIEIMNLYSRCIVSVDIPSGVCADDGKIMGCAIQADLTVTFGLPKVGHFLFPGRELCGKLKIAKIGIPSLNMLTYGINKELITTEKLRLPSRPRWSNKGTYSQVVIIGGSNKYIGAPVLSSLAALRSGASMVKVVSVSKVCECAMNHDPSLICVNIGEDFNVERLEDFISTVNKDAIFVVGPGWDTQKSEEKLNIIRKLLLVPNTMIIDADGLNVLSQNIDLLKEKNPSKSVILTPHPGEFSRLTKKTLEDVKQNYELVYEFSEKYGVITVLKDATSIISDGKKIYFNITGNTSLSKAGSGDILSGLLAGLISQHLEPIEAVKAGVYVFGLAGEMVPVEGMNSAFNILNYIPDVFKTLRENE
ncbi:bifunctional ADP-dependent NAD(P)H-hydrate dehydratase/NAD(P)H-hydrate epimerase [Fervidobacterium pennivorans subsp. shakshaketiis]|jgi:NAD(P)H-hydrate epimerase|uniref:Bifunctional NAD(P)H-hydrate repair enzyme n=1 Tax=Fervidobacterium pennivorans (strain DSM 9078 / Ven5) TaxID=771875 RepID=H9UCX2_FERPD|nr:bifunctional ADP-dependent NAD(P)H-hydrate dehydratase/NAD(P)H-hydrate epimerase [Fervidobacterium pennivorans]AFG35365.1 yjeF-like protein, hydroxyethylthiazole kinase-related protein [Fervidobacterium pennivorans DSM 9078]QIV78281.1 bifunctional ADP-dependent NAD(P)H-hydrate dehydratase/NAD(P)H-hydrate epimerase [Fervidobacterium pennivorans subsp. keratinolyticus]